MTGTADRGSPRWMRIALVASLALNLAVVGVVAGAVLRDGHDRRAPRPEMAGLGPFAEALEREDRETMREAFQREGGSFRENRAEIRRQFQALLAALRAEPYDPDATREILSGQAGKLFERITLGNELLVDRIDEMPPEARRAYADRLEERLSRRRRDAD